MLFIILFRCGAAKVNNEPIVRQATESDNAKLKEIIDLSFPSFYRFFARHSVCSEEGTVLVAETGGTVLGFAKLIEFNVGASKYGCILWIAIHPLFRRRGVALSLTKEGTDFLKREGSQAVFASTQRGNKGSLATLGKAGFVRVGFLGLWRLFGWRVFSFYRDIWFAPSEVVLMHR
jgi:ribosomal protein S18 acetylase RimI-like enzyme